MTEEDEIIRRLRKTTFDVVYAAIGEYTSTRASSGTNIPTILKILEEHGWTKEEFLDGVLQKLKTIDLNL